MIEVVNINDFFSDRELEMQKMKNPYNIQYLKKLIDSFFCEDAVINLTNINIDYTVNALRQEYRMFSVYNGMKNLLDNLNELLLAEKYLNYSIDLIKNFQIGISIIIKLTCVGVYLNKNHSKDGFLSIMKKIKKFAYILANHSSGVVGGVATLEDILGLLPESNFINFDAFLLGEKEIFINKRIFQDFSSLYVENKFYTGCPARFNNGICQIMAT